MAVPKKKDEQVAAVIEPANFVQSVIHVEGTAPFVQAKFSQAARSTMMAGMQMTKADKKAKSARPPRDYETEFIQAQHRTSDGWIGIPCVAFRAAMIDACRTVNLVMTRAKMSLFVLPDGTDSDDGTPLVRLLAGPPERTEILVRNDNGSADIRVRPMWRKWAADVRIEFDADMVTASSIVNLLDRAGRQVGVGEGRPFSRNSVGMGWGTFRVAQSEA